MIWTRFRQGEKTFNIQSSICWWRLHCQSWRPPVDTSAMTPLLWYLTHHHTNTHTHNHYYVNSKRYILMLQPFNCPFQHPIVCQPRSLDKSHRQILALPVDVIRTETWSTNDGPESPPLHLSLSPDPTNKCGQASILWLHSVTKVGSVSQSVRMYIGSCTLDFNLVNQIKCYYYLLPGHEPHKSQQCFLRHERNANHVRANACMPKTKRNMPKTPARSHLNMPSTSSV